MNAPAQYEKPACRFRIYRYDPDVDDKPAMQTLEITLGHHDKMVRDGLTLVKSEVDDSLSYRRSCREGVCGSDAMNIYRSDSRSAGAPYGLAARMHLRYRLPTTGKVPIVGGKSSQAPRNTIHERHARDTPRPIG